MLPASVISVPSGQCWAAWRTCSTIWPTGVQTIDQLGLGHALGQIDRGMGDGPHAPGHPQAALPAADADDVFGQIPLAQGQADRPADQPHPHDGDSVPRFHGIPAEAAAANHCPHAAKGRHCTRSPPIWSGGHRHDAACDAAM